MLATNFGSLCPKVTNFGRQNFGYQIWFCTRLIRWQRSESILAQVMACCLTAPSHYLNQCLLIISHHVLWHSPQTSGQFHKKCSRYLSLTSLQWRDNEHDGISNHQRLDCLLNPLFKRRSKKISKLRVTGLCEGNSLVTGKFPAQRPSNAENVSIWWWCHHDAFGKYYFNITAVSPKGQWVKSLLIYICKTQ